MWRSEDEWLNSLPENFRYQYERLWLAGVGRAVGGKRGGVENVEIAYGRRVVRTSTNQTETRGGAKGSRKSGGSADLIDSMGAIDKRRKIDRKLRALARDMGRWLGDGGATSGMRRCTVCKRYGDPDWLYCPSDGKPMEEVD